MHKPTLTVLDDEGQEHTIKGIYEVCPRCQGHGTHTNPNIDGHGITSDEWNDWGDEEKEMYFSGGYDVTCHECKGERLVVVPDVLNITAQELNWFETQQREISELRQMEEMERRMGA